MHTHAYAHAYAHAQPFAAAHAAAHATASRKRARGTQPARSPAAQSPDPVRVQAKAWRVQVERALVQRVAERFVNRPHGDFLAALDDEHLKMFAPGGPLHGIPEKEGKPQKVVHRNSERTWREAIGIVNELRDKRWVLFKYEVPSVPERTDSEPTDPVPTNPAPRKKQKRGSASCTRSRTGVLDVSPLPPGPTPAPRCPSPRPRPPAQFAH